MSGLICFLFSGKVIKQLFNERETLTKQWKDTIKMMQQRDMDVINMQEQIVTTLEVIQSQDEKLEEENNFLNNEKRNNHEVATEVQQINIIHSRMRRELNEMSLRVLFLHNEVRSLCLSILSLTIIYF